MIRSGFLSDDERRELTAVAKRPSGKTGVSRRAHAIVLLDRGMSFEAVAQVMLMDDEAVRDWHRKWVEGGAERLSHFGWSGSKPMLSQEQDEALSQALSKRVFTTTAEIIALVKDRFGITYTRSGMTKCLCRLDFEYRKPKALPKGASVAAQEAFVRRYESLMNGLAPDETVLFVDAVHPEYQSRPAHGWMKRDETVALPRTTGRQRLNLHGALCLETGACPIVQGEAISAETTIRLMDNILARNRDKSRITLILDNARYHHAKLVKQWLATKGQKITLLFLPPYAPNLNSIERLWGAMHRAVTHNRHYESFGDFAAAINSFFTQTLPKTWDRIRDTVSDTFHIINPSKFRVLT